MDDETTRAVLGWKGGTVPLGEVRNLILQEAFHHLRRYRRKGEDDVSEFLLEFHDKIEGLIRRFEPQGRPFRHYLLRTLRWQWNTFRAEQTRRRRRLLLTQDVCGEVEGLAVAEPEFGGNFGETPAPLADRYRRRLVLLALKSAPFLELSHLERVSEQTGADLSWLQACQHRLACQGEHRRRRRLELQGRRTLALTRRLLAEDEARREADPDRRKLYEDRARLYRLRLANIDRQTKALSTTPTHGELAELLQMPKGSVDSSLYHLKKDLGPVYSGRHNVVIQNI